MSHEPMIDLLFQRFSTMYGNKWSDMWVNIPMDAIKADWAAALEGLEVETIRLALESMKTTGNPFPPSQPEFVALCRQFRRRGPHALALADKRRGEGPKGGFQTLRDVLRKAQQD